MWKLWMFHVERWKPHLRNGIGMFHVEQTRNKKLDYGELSGISTDPSSDSHSATKFRLDDGIEFTFMGD